MLYLESYFKVDPNEQCFIFGNYRIFFGKGFDLYLNDNIMGSFDSLNNALDYLDKLEKEELKNYYEYKKIAEEKLYEMINQL